MQWCTWIKGKNVYIFLRFLLRTNNSFGQSTKVVEKGKQTTDPTNVTFWSRQVNTFVCKHLEDKLYVMNFLQTTNRWTPQRWHALPVVGQKHYYPPANKDYPLQNISHRKLCMPPDIKALPHDCIKETQQENKESKINHQISLYFTTIKIILKRKQWTQ